MLPPDAILLGNGAFALAGGANGEAVAATIAQAPNLQTFLSRISAGRSGNILWFDADVVFVDGSLCGASNARIVELAVAERGAWRTVALAFTSTSGLAATGDELAPAKGGPLTRYLGSAYALGGALRDDASTAVIVAPWQDVGEAAHGRNAGLHGLAPLQERKIAISSAIEVHGAGWGFASGTLEVGADPHGADAAFPARAVVFAIGDHQRWSVVSAQITSLRATARDPTITPVCPVLPIRNVPLDAASIAP